MLLGALATAARPPAGGEEQRGHRALLTTYYLQLLCTTYYLLLTTYYLLLATYYFTRAWKRSFLGATATHGSTSAALLTGWGHRRPPQPRARRAHPGHGPDRRV